MLAGVCCWRVGTYMRIIIISTHLSSLHARQVKCSKLAVALL
jgi:hypothetical protein